MQERQLGLGVCVTVGSTPPANSDGSGTHHHEAGKPSLGVQCPLCSQGCSVQLLMWGNSGHLGRFFRGHVYHSCPCLGSKKR